MRRETERKKIVYLMSREANGEMDPAVRRVTNQTKKSQQETWRKDWKAERKQFVRDSREIKEEGGREKTFYSWFGAST